MITESLSGVMELRLIHLAAAQVVSKDLFVSSSGDYLEYEGMVPLYLVYLILFIM